MLTLPRVAFVTLLVVAAAVVLGTASALPSAVASHFGAGGLANGFMPRTGYVALILGFAVLLPVFVVAMIAFVPGAGGGRSKIPHHDYWFAPERRQLSQARLLSHAYTFGCLLVLLIGGMHGLVLQANAAVPPRLNETAFFSVMAVFGIGIVVWIITLRRMFARPG